MRLVTAAANHLFTTEPMAHHRRRSATILRASTLAISASKLGTKRPNRVNKANAPGGARSLHVQQHREGYPVSRSNQQDLRLERLTDEHARTVRMIAQLTGDFDAVVEAATAVSNDDEHDPEGATIAYERAQVDAVLGMTRFHLAELEVALARVKDGTYTDCASCSNPIGLERLTARPATTLCVDCASPHARPLRRSYP
jgi:DnaK suppressor protein